MDGELQRKHGALSELPAVRSEPRPLSTEERQQKEAALDVCQPVHCGAVPRHGQAARRARQNLARQLKSGLTRGKAPRPLSAEERQQKQAELDALQPDGPLHRPYLLQKYRTRELSAVEARRLSVTLGQTDRRRRPDVDPRIRGARAREHLGTMINTGRARGSSARELTEDERRQCQRSYQACAGTLKRRPHMSAEARQELSQARKRRRVDRLKNRLVEGRTSHTRTARPGPLSVEGQQQYTLEDHEWRQAIRAWSHEDAAKEANPCH